MPRIATLALILLTATPAAAQDPYAPRPRGNGLTAGVQTYNPRTNANVRVGTACGLKLYGEDQFPSGAGLCTIGRGVGEERDRVTIIDTGARRYRIVRDYDDPSSATFYAGRNAIGLVQARGGCWVGPDVRFCAN